MLKKFSGFVFLCEHSVHDKPLRKTVANIFAVLFSQPSQIPGLASIRYKQILQNVLCFSQLKRVTDRQTDRQTDAKRCQ